MGRADGSLIEAMNSIQAHRGPDGAGVQVFPAADGSTPVALGHRRLSIIDPSERGAQPMAWADGRYWITYNGELYNFKSLRSELKADGVRFATECDTEVLLAMYEAFGPRMLERLNGIFAFAIWDSERDRLFLARDRLGVKPLYYSCHDGVFYFASEVKALLQALPRPSLRHDALPQYLTFLWVPEPETLFDGIRKLPPGHRALVANGRLEIEQYWDMSFAPGDCSREEQWVRRMREEVESSVERQMVSDVPIGAFLSGGLDSSSIVESMRRVTDDVTTYSIGFAPDDQRHEIAPDDLQYARRLAAELGVENNERVLDPGVVDLLPTLVWHLDEPIADPAAITTYLICSAAREQLTVVLSGMGADEMLRRLPPPPGGRAHPPPRPDPSARPSSAALGARRPPDDGAARAHAHGQAQRARGAQGPRPAGPAPLSLLQRLLPARAAPGAARARPARPRPRRPLRRPCRTRRASRGRALAQPAPLRRHEDIPALAQPQLHRQDEHGRVDRGACAAARRPRSSP